MHTPTTQPRHVGFVPALLIIILLATLTGCTATPVKTDKPTASPKTEKIIFPADFVNPAFYSTETHTPKQAAHDFKDLGKKYCTDAHAGKDGSVILTTTRQQHRNLIHKYSNVIRTDEKDFYNNSKEYHYTINKDYTELDAWVDSNLNPFGGSAVTLLIPEYSGYLYYLTGHTGHWDMTIKLYNCHTGELKKQYDSFRNQPSLNCAELGD